MHVIATTKEDHTHGVQNKTILNTKESFNLIHENNQQSVTNKQRDVINFAGKREGSVAADSWPGLYLRDLASSNLLLLTETLLP